MKTKSKGTIRFILLLLGSLAILLCGHLAILHFTQQDLFGNMILEAYLVNFLLAAVGFILLLVLQKQLGGLLAYLFFGFSFLKILVFFLIFHPHYQLDGKISKIEFFTFFIPYSIALVVEVYQLSKILKLQDVDNANDSEDTKD